MKSALSETRPCLDKPPTLKPSDPAWRSNALQGLAVSVITARDTPTAFYNQRAFSAGRKACNGGNMNTRSSREPKQQGTRSKSRMTAEQDFVSVPLISGHSAAKLFGIKSPQPKLVALHEAAHLVCALVLNLPLHSQAATIIPDGGLHGRVKLLRSEDVLRGSVRERMLLENYAIFYLAGRASDEIRYEGCLDSFMFTMAEGDLRNVDSILEFLLPPESSLPSWSSVYELKKYSREVLLGRAHSLLSTHWDAVLRVATALLKQKVLSADEARKIAAIRTCVDVSSVHWPRVAKKWKSN